MYTVILGRYLMVSCSSSRYHVGMPETLVLYALNKYLRLSEMGTNRQIIYHRVGLSSPVCRARHNNSIIKWGPSSYHSTTNAVVMCPLSSKTARAKIYAVVVKILFYSHQLGGIIVFTLQKVNHVGSDGLRQEAAMYVYQTL